MHYYVKKILLFNILFEKFLLLLIELLLIKVWLEFWFIELLLIKVWLEFWFIELLLIKVWL